MTRDMKLADEILTLASATSLDYQEHVLDVKGDEFHPERGAERI